MAKNYNIHLAYVTGILAALLVGSISVNWNGIKDLAGIISFALGLSSLILAVIAIVQSLGSNQSTVAFLAEINQAARLIVPASKAISETSSDLLLKVETMTKQYKDGSETMSRLETSLASMSTVNRIDPRPADSQSIETSALGSLTNGASPAVLCALLSYKNKRYFSFREILPDQSDYSLAYMDGVIGGLLAAKKITRTIENRKFLITNFCDDVDLALERFKQKARRSSKPQSEVYAAVYKYYDNPASDEN